jgi:hypothetical protein
VALLQAGLQHMKRDPETRKKLHAFQRALAINRFRLPYRGQ